MSDDLTTPGAQRRAWIEAMDGAPAPAPIAAELLEDLAGHEDYTPPEWIRERAMLAKRIARLEAVAEDAERERDRLRSIIDQLADDAAAARADRGLRDAEICIELRMVAGQLLRGVALAAAHRLTAEDYEALRDAIIGALDRLDPPELHAACPGCGATPDDDDVCVCDCAVEEAEP